ncbi:MAG: DUF2683 family protein [Bacteroidota bacterium]
MKPANILIAHPASSSKLDALVAVMKALDIKYEVSPYDAEYVGMIRQGDKDRKAGKGKKITTDDLDALWK